MPFVLTGNRLETGDVLWWNGSDWSLDLRDAATMEKADAEALVARFQPAERISDLVAVEVTVTEAGLRPTSTRERVRAVGPSVRPDFARPSLSVSEI
jgi:hypothetical protein